MVHRVTQISLKMTMEEAQRMSRCRQLFLVFTLTIFVVSIVIFLFYSLILQPSIDVREYHYGSGDPDFVVEVSYLSLFPKDAIYSLNDFVGSERTAHRANWTLINGENGPNLNSIPADRKLFLASGRRWHLHLSFSDRSSRHAQNFGIQDTSASITEH